MFLGLMYAKDDFILVSAEFACSTIWLLIQASEGYVARLYAQLQPVKLFHTIINFAKR